MSVFETCSPLANKAGAPCPYCGSINEVCFKPPKPAADLDKHDPLARRLPGEPYWAALARDHIAPFLPRIYACAILRNFDLLDAVVAKLKAHMSAAEPRPHKDQEHAWACRAKAQEMEDWRREHMKTTPASGRVNSTGPELNVTTTLGTPADAQRIADEVLAGYKKPAITVSQTDPKRGDPREGVDGRYAFQEKRDDPDGDFLYKDFTNVKAVQVISACGVAVDAKWEGTAQCGICDGVVSADPATGIFPACGAPTCPFPIKAVP